MSAIKLIIPNLGKNETQLRVMTKYRASERQLRFEIADLNSQIEILKAENFDRSLLIEESRNQKAQFESILDEIKHELEKSYVESWSSETRSYLI
jgi:predicted RNase H-like nuclease (RuvC/YqgF family)